MENGMYKPSQELRDYLCAVEDYYLQTNYYDINYHQALTLLRFCTSKVREKEDFIFRNWNKYKDKTYIRFYREIRIWLLISLAMSGYMDLIIERVEFELLLERFISLRERIEKEAFPNEYSMITF